MSRHVPERERVTSEGVTAPSPAFGLQSRVRVETIVDGIIWYRSTLR